MSFAPLASLDGVIGPAARASIPATDEGLLRGDGIFEVVPIYGGRAFGLEQHLARLERSAAGLRLPLDAAAVAADVEALLRAAGPFDGGLRIVVTRGGRRVLLTEPPVEHSSTIRLGIVTFSPTRVLDQIKSLSYGANMLAGRLARERGFDEALLVTPHGRVLEAPTSSFFWATGGVLYTPPLADRILESITRAAVIELTGALERATTVDDLRGAEEAFLASSTREVQAVSAIEEIVLRAPGPLTAAATEGLRAHIAAVAAGP